MKMDPILSSLSNIVSIANKKTMKQFSRAIHKKMKPLNLTAEQIPLKTSHSLAPSSTKTLAKKLKIKNQLGNLCSHQLILQLNWKLEFNKILKMLKLSLPKTRYNFKPK